MALAQTPVQGVEIPLPADRLELVALKDALRVSNADIMRVLDISQQACNNTLAPRYRTQQIRKHTLLRYHYGIKQVLTLRGLSANDILSRLAALPAEIEKQKNEYNSHAQI